MGELPGRIAVGQARGYLRAEIPLPVRDNTGVAFPQADLDWFEGGLRRLGSGFTKHREAWGEWEENGVIYREPISVYILLLQAERRDELIAFLDEACRVFRQEAMLLELCPVEKILLSPVPWASERAYAATPAGKG